jgi:outer membrane receptor for ferrienterochelin and colicins
MKTCKIFLVILSLPILVAAQDNASGSSDLFELPLEQLMNLQVTTATKTAGKSDAAPAVIEIITAEQIKVRGYQHLAHILNDIGNNHEDRSNWGIGEPTNQNVGFGFRFDTGQNMLILFNGQRLNAFLPGNRFGGEEYLLNNIDRVEIIRGPGSALYGTGAFTCVVNIISKKLLVDSSDEIIVSGEFIPTSKGLAMNNAATLRIGKQGTLSTAFRYFKEEGQKLNVKNALFGDATLTDGVNHALDGEIFINNGSFNVFSKITNQSRKTFTGFNGVNPSAMDELKLNMYAYSIGTDKTFKTGARSDLKISAGWHQDNWTEVALIPQFKVSDDGSRLLVDDAGLPILDNLSLYRNGENVNTSFFIDGQGADTRSLDAEVQFTSNYIRSNNIVVGIYLANDKILDAERPSELNLSPLGFVPFRAITDSPNNWLFDLQATRKTLAAFAQIDYNVTAELNVAAGLRMDAYSGSGVLTAQRYNELNPKASVVYQVDEKSTIKLLYGTATRIPNGFETLSSVSILGDPYNRPERITTYQLQWISNWSANIRTELGGFRSSISHRLETNANISDELRAQGFIGQFVNTGAMQNQLNNGIDGKFVSRFKTSTFSLNFTQYFGSDDGYGNAIAYMPNTMMNVDYTLKIKTLIVNAGVNYRGGFKKSMADPREPVKDYLVSRLNLLYQPIKSQIEFRVSLRNMFNAKYFYPSSSIDFTENFPARGIELSLGIIYRPSL